MQLIWITDPHLNFLPHGGARAFGQYVRQDHPDMNAVVVTGDIAECPNFRNLIEQFAEGADAPVWFVLGNHDAYGGSISQMKATAKKMTGRAKWLVSEQLVELAAGIALVGHDGWYDARLGLREKSNVLLSDFHHIKEFRGKWPKALMLRVAEVADSAAAEARGLLEAAIAKGYKQIVFGTHVPPFSGATWHEGKTSDGHWLPWMSSKVMGEMLLEVSGEHPDVDFTVLCGHTHSSGELEMGSNLRVFTGHSEYRVPRVCGKLVVDAKVVFEPVEP